MLMTHLVIPTAAITLYIGLINMTWVSLTAHQWIELGMLLGFFIVWGAFSGPGTLFHNLSLAFDIFMQCFGWNKVLCITISSRAGLAARNGHPWWSYFVGAVMLAWWKNPAPTLKEKLLSHGEGAILADWQRTIASQKLLAGRDKEALKLIAQLESIAP